MPLQPSTIYSCPWQMSQATFFPVKPSVQLYSDRKLCACHKLGNGLGVGKCLVPGQCKICKFPTPGTDKADKCPAVAGGAGGAGHRWCCCVALVYNTIHIFFRSIFLRKLFNIRFSSGCKENHFYSSPFGQAEANNYQPKRHFNQPQKLFEVEVISQFFCCSNS